MSTKGSVQDEFLKKAADSQAVMRANLVSGKDISGRIKAFDNFTVVFATKGIEILVYKSAIAALGPGTEGE